jgi:hypothetical protein
MATIVFLCVASLVPTSIASSAAAAEPDSLSLKEGDRVRVTIAGMKAVCIIEEMQPGILDLRSSETGALQHVRIADISSLEIRAPRSHGAGAGRGAMIGGGVGFLVGALYGIAVSAAFNPSPSETGTLGVAGGIGFFFIGAGLGALGGLMVPGETWKPVPLDTQIDVGVSPNGTIGVGITIPIGGS